MSVYVDDAFDTYIPLHDSQDDGWMARKRGVFADDGTVPFVT